MATEQITTFDDLMGLLERNPEYRERLRQHILDEEFRRLPAEVRSLSETVRSHTALLENIVRTLESHTRLLEHRGKVLEHHGQQLSRLIGDESERRFRDNAAGIFGRMMRRIRVIDKFELADLLDDAVDSGVVTEGDQRSLLALDLALRGVDRITRQPAHMAVEISSGIGERDIMRAVDRARLLEKLTGYTTKAVVAGYSISPAYLQLADDKGVEVTTIAPPDAGETELPIDFNAEDVST